MPAPAPNRFTTYEFSEQELQSAELLNPLQKMRIQTEVGKIAQQMLNLDCASTSEISDFEVQRSFLKGQIVALEFILQLSETRELNIIEEANQQEYKMDPVGPNLYSAFHQPDPSEPISGE